jgi:hypothetical protein
MEKFTKIVTTIFGVLVLIPSLLSLLGVIEATAAPELIQGLGNAQQLIIEIAGVIAGLVSIFSGGTESLSTRNVW